MAASEGSAEMVAYMMEQVNPNVNARNVRTTVHLVYMYMRPCVHAYLCVIALLFSVLEQCIMECCLQCLCLHYICLYIVD